MLNVVNGRRQSASQIRQTIEIYKSTDRLAQFCSSPPMQLIDALHDRDLPLVLESESRQGQIRAAVGGPQPAL